MSEESNSTSPIRASRRRRGQHMTTKERKQAQETFLKVFASTANVRASCMKAGIDRSQVYRWQEHDEEFAQRFRAASLEADDAIRAEIWRRGIQGVEEPVVSVGKLVYVDGKPLTVRKYSDNLLALLAKARMPEFREKQDINLTTNPGTVEIYKIRIPDNSRDERG